MGEALSTCTDALRWSFHRALRTVYWAFWPETAPRFLFKAPYDVLTPVQLLLLHLQSCEKVPAGLKQSVLAEDSGSFSRDRSVTAYIDALEVKPEEPLFRTHFLPNLSAALVDLHTTTVALQEAQALSKTAFDNAKHEPLLVDLWNLLNPVAAIGSAHAVTAGSAAPAGGAASHPTFERFGAHWGQLGFQGRDPATDFRGMGLLGLQALLYAARAHGRACRTICSKCDLPFKGYPLALTVIQLTDYALGLGRQRKLDLYFALHCKQQGKQARLQALFAFVCHCLVLFEETWSRAPPRDIMGFPAIFTAFKADVEGQLARAEQLLRDMHEREQDEIDDLPTQDAVEGRTRREFLAGGLLQPGLSLFIPLPSELREAESEGGGGEFPSAGAALGAGSARASTAIMGTAGADWWSAGASAGPAGGGGVRKSVGAPAAAHAGSTFVANPMAGAAAFGDRRLSGPGNAAASVSAPPSSSGSAAAAGGAKAEAEEADLINWHSNPAAAASTASTGQDGKPSQWY